jgi:putative SOS response-associated peptidase YedK
MCGRFTLYSSKKIIADLFRLHGIPNLAPRYNISPSQQVAVVRATQTDRELAMLRWGLIPGWAKDSKIAPINAQAETADKKPFFRHAMKKQRCLVPADGWYEWKAEGKKKLPFYFGAKDGAPVALAGLWESWEKDGELLETFALLTTEANKVAATVHTRMPVIIPSDEFERWLDLGNQDVATLQDLLLPSQAEKLVVRPVSTRVNNPKNEEAECIEALA